MSGLRALFLLEVRTMLRDRALQLMFVVTALSGALVLPGGAFLADLQEPKSLEGADPSDEEDSDEAGEGGGDTEEPTPGSCSEANAPSVFVDDPAALPEGLIWPIPWSTEEQAKLRLTVEAPTEPAGIPTLRLTRIDRGGSLIQGRICLTAALRRVQLERQEALGLDPIPDPIATTEGVETPDGEEEAEEAPLFAGFSAFGSLLGAVALVIAGSLAIEAVPRRRSSGLLEQLRSTQTRELELVWAWLLALLALTGATCAAWALAYAASITVYPAEANLLPGVHSLAFGLVIGAASIRTSLQAADVQAATLRWFAVLFALLLAGGLSVALLGKPWLAALVPLGGSLLATTGILGPWGFLADLASLGWTALIALWCARSLAAEESSAAGVDPGLQRQARGNYLPEAFVLGCMGISCGILSGGSVFSGNFWVGATFGFVGFMLLPSLLAGPVLGIPSRELLPLSRPRPRDVLLALPMTVGMFGLAILVMGATTALVPVNPIIRGFEKAMQEATQGPFGQLAIGLYPAVCEELLYRGAILGLLLRSGRTRLAIVGQAVLFSAAHVISIRLPWTFVFGLVMGWIRVKTGSLWATMALHFCFNLTATLLPLVITVEFTEIGWQEAALASPLLLALAVLPLYRRPTPE